MTPHVEQVRDTRPTDALLAVYKHLSRAVERDEFGHILDEDSIVAAAVDAFDAAEDELRRQGLIPRHPPTEDEDAELLVDQQREERAA